MSPSYYISKNIIEQIPYAKRKFVVCLDDNSLFLKKETDFIKKILKRPPKNIKNSLKKFYYYLFCVPSRIRSYIARKRGYFVNYMSIEEACKYFKFYPHADYNIFYVCHPYNPIKYYQIGDFHRYLYEDKVDEFINILINLGPKKFKVENKYGYSSQISSAIMANIPIYCDNANLNLNKITSTGSNILIECQFGDVYKQSLPKNLYWYENIKDWKQMVTAWEKGNLKKWKAEIKYFDDYGIDKNIALEVKKIGFKIGSKFEEKIDTVWIIDIEF